MTICALHLVDGLPQATVAQWLALPVQMVQRCISRSLKREPRLQKLKEPMRRPRVRTFSELPDGVKGPFNADEI